MIEKFFRRVSRYVEMIGIVFQDKLESFKDSNSELFEKLKDKEPPLPDRAPRSNIFGKVFDFVSPENFSVFRLYVIMAVLFILGAPVSFIPILYPSYYALAVALFIFGVLLVGVGGRLTRKIENGLEGYEAPYELLGGFFVIGLFGLIVNFVSVGIPLFDSALRYSYHNRLWSMSIIFYMLGMMGVYVKNRDGTTFNLLFVLSFLIALFSGFRTDFLILLGPLVVYRYLKDDFSKSRVFYLAAFFLFFVVAIRYTLLTFSSMQPSLQHILTSDIFLGKIGLNFHALSIFIMEGGLWGVGEGMISAGKFFFQIVRIPSWDFGAVGADLVINMTRRFESSLVGPTYLDMGIPGVLFFMVLVGFLAELPKRLYKLASSDFFLALYAVQVSIMLVWVQTGIVQYYLFYLFFIIGFYCLWKVKG